MMVLKVDRLGAYMQNITPVQLHYVVLLCSIWTYNGLHFCYCQREQEWMGCLTGDLVRT